MRSEFGQLNNPKMQLMCVLMRSHPVTWQKSPNLHRWAVTGILPVESIVEWKSFNHHLSHVFSCLDSVFAFGLLISSLPLHSDSELFVLLLSKLSRKRSHAEETPALWPFSLGTLWAYQCIVFDLMDCASQPCNEIIKAEALTTT